jgi:hypothetical protein
LEPTARLLEFAELVIQLSAGKEPCCARDGNIFDAEINPENRSVLGSIPFGVSLRATEPKMQRHSLVTSDGERTLGHFPIFGIEILALVAISVLRET